MAPASAESNGYRSRRGDSRSGYSSDSTSSQSLSSGDIRLSSPRTPSSEPSSLHPDDCTKPERCVDDQYLPRQLRPSLFYPITLSLQSYPSFTPDPVPLLPENYIPLPFDITPHEVDPKDIGTPDEWIMRDQRLVRLTGRWPFNCEAPLTDLFNAVSLLSVKSSNS